MSDSLPAMVLMCMTVRVLPSCPAHRQWQACGIAFHDQRREAASSRKTSHCQRLLYDEFAGLRALCG